MVGTTDHWFFYLMGFLQRFLESETSVPNKMRLKLNANELSILDKGVPCPYNIQMLKL